MVQVLVDVSGEVVREFSHLVGDDLDLLGRKVDIDGKAGILTVFDAELGDRILD